MCVRERQRQRERERESTVKKENMNIRQKEKGKHRAFLSVKTTAESMFSRLGVFVPRRQRESFLLGLRSSLFQQLLQR